MQATHSMPQLHPTRFEGLRAMDAEVASKMSQRFILGLLTFAWFMACVFLMGFATKHIADWLAEMWGWSYWLQSLFLMLVAFPMALLATEIFVKGVGLGERLFSLPFVNLLFAVLWGCIAACLFCTLPYLFADLAEVPFRQWALWQKVVLPPITLVLQVLLLAALVELCSSDQASDMPS